MIKHVVFFKLAPFAEGNSKQENALYLKEELENLQGLIPELLKIEVFINIPDVAADNYDIVLMAEFENLEGLNLYINNPEHVKVSSFISKVRIGRAAIDYDF